jgi:hypothetical protein
MGDARDAYLSRVSYHAVVRYVQRVGTVRSFVPRGERSTQRWASDSCKAVGTSVEAVQRAILTDAVVAALMSESPHDSVFEQGFVVKLAIGFDGRPFVTTIFRTMHRPAVPRLASRIDA